MLNIVKEKNEKTLLVCLEGRLDAETAPELDSGLLDEIEYIEELVFDLKSLDYISSAGLREFMKLQKIMNRQGKMVVKNPNENVREIINVTGFSEILSLSGD